MAITKKNTTEVKADAQVKKEAPKAVVKPAAKVLNKVEAKPVAKAETKVVAKPAAKTTAKPAAKAATKPAAKAETKTAAKPAAKKAPAKKVALKSTLTVQFDGKSYSEDDLVKIAKDIWKYDLKKKVGDFQTVDLYVKPEEAKAYYVINGQFTGDFTI